MIGWYEIFDFSDPSQVKEAIKLIEKLDSTYESFIKGLTGLKNKYVKDVDELVKSTEDLAKSVSSLNPAIESNRQTISQMSKTADIATKQYDELKKEISLLEKQVEKLTKEKEKFNESQKKTIDLDQQVLTLEKKLASLEDERTKKVIKLKDEIQKKTKALKEDISENNELTKLKGKLNDLDSESAKEISKTRLQIQQRNKELKESAKESLGLVSIYQKEAKRLVDLRNEYKNVALAQGENSKEAKALQKEVEELDAKLKSVDENAGQFQRNVGGYAEALKEVGGSSGAAVNGVESLNVTFKALLANPVAIVIAAIVGALTLLGKAFFGSEKGARLLNRASAITEGLFSSLIGITDDLTDVLSKAWDDPKKALKEVGNLILNSIINRFKAIPLFVKIAGEAFDKLIDKDFSGLSESVEDVEKAFIQLATGFDSKQQDKISKSTEKLTKDILENADAFQKLADARRELIKQNRQLEISIERLITKEEQLLAIRDDATLSFAARAAAAESAADIIEKRAQAELTLASRNLDIINQEIDLRKENGENIQELLDQQLDAQKTLESAQRGYILSVRENEKERRQLVQDTEERNLDILIDGFDNRKTINERLIADDRIAFEKRKALADQTAKLSEDSFSKQIESLQKFTDESINANDLLATDDAVLLNQKIRNLGLSEILEGRLLEVIRERRTVVQDLADVERDLEEEGIDRKKRLAEVTQFELDRISERKALEADLGVFRIRGINQRVQAEIAAEQFRTDTLLEDETLLAEEREKIRQETQDNITAIEEEGAKYRQAILEEEVQNAFRFAGLVSNLFSAISNRRTQEEDQRIDQLENQRDRELEIAGNNAKEQQSINEKFDKSKETIEKNQAERARRLAIFQKTLAVSQSIIETSLAVISALKSPPGPPYTIPAAVATGVFGGLRTAAIIAQPIPAFATGTDYAPGGLSWVAEEGREMIIEPSGRTYIVDGGAQLIDLPQGSKVLENSRTEAFIDKSFKSDLPQKVVEKEVIVVNDYSGIVSAVKSLPVNQTVMNEDGFNNYLIEKNARIKFLNKQKV